jgi:hypothetical protein
VLSLADVPVVRVFTPSELTDFPATVVLDVVTGGLVTGVMIVVVSDVEVWARTALVIIPSAAAPANKSLVMHHAFQSGRRRGI